MIRSWSKDAGAPAVPAAFAVASGILAAASLSVLPPAALVWLLAGAGGAAVVSSRRGDPRIGVLGAVVVLAAVGSWRLERGFLEPARRTEAAARALGESAVIEVTGRLDRLWSRTGSLHRTRLAVESVSSEGRRRDLPGPLRLVVAGSDFEPEEIHRRSSVSTSLLRCTWNHTTINLLDTPGALSLLGEAMTALQAVDAVIIVLTPSSGIRSELIRLWSHVKERQLPCLIFVTEQRKGPEKCVVAGCL